MRHRLIILLVLIFVSGCNSKTPNDIDEIFSNFKPSEFEYSTKCTTPKLFSALKKKRVTCLTSEEPGAWENSFNQSQSSVFIFMSQKGFEYVGSTHTPGETDIQAEPINGGSIVYEKISETENCNRRIYLDVSDLMDENEIVRTDKTTTLFIADPKDLYCDEARLLRSDL